MPQKNNNAPANIGAPRPLTVRRQIAAECIASGMTWKQSAEKAGLTMRGLELAMKDPRMKALIETKIVEITRQMRAKLRGCASVAVLALAKVAADQNAPPAARVSAATAILDRIGVGKTSIVEVVNDDKGLSVEERLDRLSMRLGAALSSVPDADDAPLTDDEVEDPEVIQDNADAED